MVLYHRVLGKFCYVAIATGAAFLPLTNRKAPTRPGAQQARGFLPPTAHFLSVFWNTGMFIFGRVWLHVFRIPLSILLGLLSVGSGIRGEGPAPT